jgi:tRNA (Thr-GGU) A37 N-methylase
VIEPSYTIEPIGVIRSELDSREATPLQGYEGAPEAWLELTAPVEQGLVSLTAGDDVLILTWLHRARRDVLQVHPRGRLEAPLTGVFATLSPSQPRGTSPGFGSGGRRTEAEGRANGGNRQDVSR